MVPAMSEPVLSIRGLTKTYASGLTALNSVDLDIGRGEIFALLGPNGAGKTTLISIICGLVTGTSGTIHVAGHDVSKDFRPARTKIGLVPQELYTDAFERVIDTVTFSRGLFGKPRNPAYIERILRELSLWEKRNERLKELSGGMKRRVMIAKALAHEPEILFLDEPTAGVDVELRRDMWEQVRQLRESGVTIILTTHYIEEAEEMADRVGVIRKGELILVEEKNALMQKLGRKELTLNLAEPMTAIPPELSEWNLRLGADGQELHYEYDGRAERSGIPSLLRRLTDLGVAFKDLNTHQSSLEDIFVSLVHEERAA
jgi:ABC-2 type transport system ATP-binding protein